MKDLSGVKAFAALRKQTAEQREREAAVHCAMSRFAIESTGDEWVRHSHGWRLILQPGLYLDYIAVNDHSGHEPYLTRYKRNRRGKGVGMETSFKPIYTPEDFIRLLNNWRIAL